MPQTLPQQDFQQRFTDECIQGSAIDASLYATAISFIEDSGRWEVYQALGLEVSRFWQFRKPHDFGAAACFRNESGTLWQVKPENPTIDPKKGKAAKYIAPKGIGARAFMPAIPLNLWEKIADRHGLALPEWVALEISLGRGNSRSIGFWQWIAQHPEIPIILTEGGKKSLSLLSHGYVAIALFGINAGVSKWETIGGEKIRKAKPELIPDLQPYACEGRRWILSFDQDEKPATRDKVAAALGDLSFQLEQSGGEAAIAEWDGRGGLCKGVDDLIANAGIQAWEQSYQQAIPARQWRIQRELARRVRRRPDLHIGDREFSAALPSLPASGIIAFHGGKGSGKSRAIGAILRANPSKNWLSLTHRIALGRDQGGGWGGILINDGDRYGDRLLDAQGQPVSGGTACFPSLLKVNRIKADILILDEITAGLEFLLGSQICNKQGIRPLLLEEFHRRIREAELVLIADADLSEDALRFIEAIRGERAYLVRSDRQALTYDCSILEGSQNAAIAALIERFEVLEDGKAIYINADSKKLSEALSKLLEGMGITSLTITADTSGGEIERDFLSSKGKAIPGLIAQGVRAIISSPSVSQGFSIECHTDRIDSVWGFYGGGSITPIDMAQSLDRVRANDCPRFVWAANHGSAYSRLSSAQSVPAFLRDFKSINTAAARLVRHSLTPAAIAATDALDWQSENLRMLASLEVRRNRGMADLRDSLIALLRLEGKRIACQAPSISIGEARAANAAIKAAARAIAMEQAEAIAAARRLTEAEAEALSRKSEALSLEDSRALQRYFLERFYQADVDSDLVLFDRAGATRQEIRNLERLLDSAKAIDRTAGSINQNPDSPQDWSRAAVKAFLFEKSGFTELVRGIVAGEISILSDEVISPIAAFIRSHPEEFRLAFGISKLDSIADRQIVGQMLRSVGIKSQRKGNRNNHRYEVRKPELESLLEIIERRKRKITPPPSIDLNQGGVIPSEIPEIQPDLPPLPPIERGIELEGADPESGYSWEITIEEDVAA